MHYRAYTTVAIVIIFSVGLSVLAVFYWHIDSQPSPQSSTSTSASSSSTSAPNVCLWNGSTPLSSLHVAVVEPVFTSTAYDHNGSSFYGFYSLNAGRTGNVTSDLNYLNVSLVSSWNTPGLDDSVYSFLGSHPCGLQSITLLTDTNLTEGVSLRGYNAIFLAHNEYATENEYESLKNYVSSGGLLVFTESNDLYARVGYSNSYVWLISGHGWKFNGVSAWNYSGTQWQQEDTNWIGSVYSGVDRLGSRIGYTTFNMNCQNAVVSQICQRFGESTFIIFEYGEVNSVINYTDTEVIGGIGPVTSIIHQYGAGHVLSLDFDAPIAQPEVQTIMVNAMALYG